MRTPAQIKATQEFLKRNPWYNTKKSKEHRERQKAIIVELKAKLEEKEKESK